MNSFLDNILTIDTIFKKDGNKKFSSNHNIGSEVNLQK